MEPSRHTMMFGARLMRNRYTDDADFATEIPMKKSAQCGFCDGRGVTKEHLWPDWLRTLILSSRAQGHAKKFTMEIERGRKTTRFSSATLGTTVHMPCGKCNHGWMSALEGNIKPFVTEMVFPGAKTMLSAERQALLAKWAVKTAMVFEYVSVQDEKYFTPDERATFRSLLEIPQNTWVWTGHYDAAQPAHGLQHRIGQRRQDVSVTPAYSLTLTAGFFALQVFAYRKPASGIERLPVRRGPWKEALLPIWPASAAGLMWPPALMMDDRVLHLLDNRFVTETG